MKRLELRLFELASTPAPGGAPDQAALLARYAELARAWEPSGRALAAASGAWSALARCLPGGLVPARAAAARHERLARSWAAEARQYAALGDYYLALELGDRGRRAEAIPLLEAACARWDARTPVAPLFPAVLAGMLRDEGDARAALVAVDEGLAELAEQRARELPSYGDSAETSLLLERGAAQVELGMPDLARPTLERAFELARWLELKPEEEWQRAGLLASATVYLMNCARAEEDLRALESLAARCEELAGPEQLAGVPQWTQVRLRLGFGLVEAERRGEAPPTRAAELLEELLAGAELPVDERIRTLAKLARARLDRAEEPSARARELAAARAALEEGEALLAEVRSEGLSTYGVELAWVRVRYELAAGASRESLLRLRAERALPAFEAFLAHWEATPLRAGGVGYLGVARRLEVLEQLARLELALEGEREGARRALEHLVRAQALGSQARALGLGAPALERCVAALAPRGRGLVCFLPGRGGSLALALDEAGVTSHALPPLFELRERARAVNAAIHEAVHGERAWGERELERALPRAAQAFLPPDLRARVAGWEALALVGADSLGYLPFEALPFEGEPLGEARALSYLPSLPIGLWLAEREASLQAPARPRLVVIGGDGAAPADEPLLAGLTPLDLKAADFRSLRAPWPESELVLSAGLAEGGLEALDWRGASALHVFAHGVFDADAERPAGVALVPRAGRAGVLFAADLEGRGAPPLVALTVCGAGRKQMRRGDDGRGGLAASWLEAGAQTVLLAVSDLELNASLELATRFHEHLARGLAPDRALQLARRESDPTRAGNPAVHDALVHLVGLAHVPRAAPEERGLDPRLLLGGGALALALVLALVRTRRRA